MGELAAASRWPAAREWTGEPGCRIRAGAQDPGGRAAGRPWTVGDIAMVADGQWAVGARCGRWDEGAVVEERIAEGCRA
ncbi:hypothetical protein [Streptomyces sp. JH34]|uniref:hypothetical protein n=1 Tax=Streptomyces sp. JH34 TaxID=2793633 RepID=UPI0023F71201|nr:hypothetical protein [Streptomyces sp. JH34]MDF6020943.1 hypothetical protein [Streptomyces sp. JH34]